MLVSPFLFSYSIPRYLSIDTAAPPKFPRRVSFLSSFTPLVTPCGLLLQHRVSISGVAAATLLEAALQLVRP